MRYHRDAPKNVMEALFVHLMKWGKEQGYRRFAPRHGAVVRLRSSRRWRRCGIGSARSSTQHGEAIYNFQGLRAYKEKFNPVWEPHYLAYPGGLRLPRIMADVSALVAGGYGGIFLK